MNYQPQFQPTPSHAPGRGMLKVTGVLYTVFGGLSVIFALLVLLGAALISEFGGMLDMGMGVADVTAGLAAALGFLMLAQSGFSIFVGVAAIKNAADVHKAAFVRTLIIIHMALLLVQAILDFSLLAVINFVVPVIAIIGAQKNVTASTMSPPPSMPGSFDNNNPYNNNGL